MLPEFHREDWVRLDLNPARVIARYLQVQMDLGSVEVDAVLIDTGSALPLLAPEAEAARCVDLASCPPSTVSTAGGDVKARQFEATIRLGEWTFSGVEVHASPRFERWIIGIPVLKHFNLMLRDPVVHAPVLWGPRSRIHDGARWI